MAHLSIAIIRRIASTVGKDNSQSILNNEEACNYEYLVIKFSNQKYKFFDHKPKGVIGDRFNYTDFKDKVLKFLNLDNIEKNVFEKSPSLFKVSGSEDDATAYLYQLKNNKEVNERLSENIEWIDSDRLLVLEKDWVNNQKFIFKSEKPFSEATFTNELKTDIRKLVKANQNNKLVIFAGAGVSKDSGLPDWKTLTKSFKSEIDEIEDNILSVTQLHLNQRGKKESLDALKNALRYNQTHYNLIHEQIVKLRPFHILTTNYDEHFEQVIYKQQLKYSVVRKDADLPDCNSNSFLVKMHGDIAEKNIVLTKYDYDHYKNNFPLIKGFVEGVFATNLVLFIGFSFDDPNLQELLKRVNNILQASYQPPYLLYIPDNNKKKREINSEVSKLTKLGLKVILYNDNSVTQYYNELIRKNTKESERKEMLSQIGQKVYKFLRVLEKYDYNDDDFFSKKNIEIQLVGSLDRFDGLEAIPISILKTIIPFKVPKAEFASSLNADYSPFTLSTLNEDLLLYLNSTGSKQIDFEINNLSVPKSVQKSLKLVNQSGVGYINRKNDFKSQLVKLVAKQDQSCNCLRCRLFDFDYGEVLSQIEQIALISNDYESTHLHKAYAMMKTGQFVKAYYLFESIKSRLSEEHKYILFFISCYNQKLIRSYLHFANEPNIKEQELEDIKAEIDTIDLDKMILEIPVHDDVKRVLYFIKDNSLLIETKRSIKNDVLKICDLYENYKHEGYFSMGSAYWFNVQAEFYLLWNFYRLNLLFNDDKYEFRELAFDYIKGMIASNMVSEKYDQRMKFYSPFFITIVTYYIQPKQLKQLLLEFKVMKFEFDEENSISVMTDLITNYENLCRSGYKKHDFFGETVSANQLFNFRTFNFSYFANKICEQFNSFLLVFTKISLNVENVNKIIDESLNFLEVSSLFNSSGAHEFFLDFVSTYISDISQKNIDRLINYSISDNIWSDSLIYSICDLIVNKKNQTAFIDEKLFNRILNRTSERRQHSIQIANITPFYQLLLPELRPKMYELIITDYSKGCIKNGGVNPFSSLHKWGVWNPIENKDMFDLFLDYLMKCSKEYPDIIINDNLEEVDLNSVVGLNELYFFVNIIYKYKMFGHESVTKVFEHIKSKMFKWALKPKEFNYTLFDYKWIAYLEIEEMYSILREIPELVNSVKSQLTFKYNPKVSKVYFEKII